jgi:hypothetical protein
MCDCLRAHEFWYQAEPELNGEASAAGSSANPDEKVRHVLEVVSIPLRTALSMRHAMSVTCSPR